MIFKTTIYSHVTFEFFFEFLNPKIGQHTRMINKILYENYPTIQNNWTPIIAKVQEIQVKYEITFTNLEKLLIFISNYLIFKHLISQSTLPWYNC
jgi:hypothetical protein